MTSALTEIINRYGIDEDLNIPDYLISEFLISILDNLKITIQRRDRWYGFKPTADFVIKTPSQDTPESTETDKT